MSTRRDTYLPLCFLSWGLSVGLGLGDSLHGIVAHGISLALALAALVFLYRATA